MAERGSVLWFLLSAIQLWMTFAMMEEATAAVELLFGSSAAACFVLGLFVFRQEQVDFVSHDVNFLICFCFSEHLVHVFVVAMFLN